MRSNRISTLFRSDSMLAPRPSSLTCQWSLTAAASLAACLVAACSDTNAGMPAPGGDASIADTGSTPTDSGSTPTDSGSTPTDSGSPPVDSGSAPMDAGSTSTPVVPACPASDAGATTLTFTNHTYLGDPRVRPAEALFSGINTIDDPNLQVMTLHNAGTTAVTVTSVGVADQAAATLFPVDYRQHSNPKAFGVTVLSGADAGAAPLALPATIPAGGDLAIQVQFLSTNTSPPTRFDNTGGEAVAAWLVAQTATDCAQAGLYGVSLWNTGESISPTTGPTINYARYEPTLGQILATLGYQINVGENLKTFLNVNQVDPVNVLSPPPLGDSPSDELLVRDFVKADQSQPAVLLAVGRFSPKIDYPFGYFPSESVTAATAQPPPVEDGGTAPSPLKVVATMISKNNTDTYTSDHSEMVLPIVTDNLKGTFEPGDASFGIWSFTAQRSYGTVAFDGGVTPNFLNGDYDYSYDELNIISAGDGGTKSPVHRVRFWPLKDRTGHLVPNAYLIGWEEAGNGDYQDMLYVLMNVTPLSLDAGITPPPSPSTDAASDAKAESDAKAD